MLLAKLRVTKEAAETGALTTVRGQEVAFLESSSSLLVGMVALEQPPMAQLHPRQLVFLKSADSFAKSCHKRLPKSLQSLTLQSLSFERDKSDSLTLHSWSFAIDSLYLDSLSLPEDRFHSLNWNSLSLQNSNSQSLILHSLHDKRDRLCSLTLPSLSLIDENCFPRMSFKETSFEHGILEELDETLAHTKLKRKAGTNSFSTDSFTKTTLAQEAGTNSFFNSFSYRIWSLRMCLRMLLFCSFQLMSAALFLRTCFCTSTFPKESLQEEQLVAAYFTNSFQTQSLQTKELEVAYQLDLCTSLGFTCFSLSRCSRSTLESFNQLDPTTSLSLPQLGSISFSYQLQADSFDRISFELRAFRGAASLQIPGSGKDSFRAFSFQSNSLAEVLFKGEQLCRKELRAQQGIAQLRP